MLYHSTRKSIFFCRGAENASMENVRQRRSISPRNDARDASDGDHVDAVEQEEQFKPEIIFEWH